MELVTVPYSDSYCSANMLTADKIMPKLSPLSVAVKEPKVGQDNPETMEFIRHPSLNHSGEGFHQPSENSQSYQNKI